MKRLQRKCLVIAAVVHVLLLVLLVVGAGFMGKRTPPPRDLPILHAIPQRIIDEAFSGGWEPSVAAQSTPAPPVRVEEPREVARTPPRVQPQPAPTRREPEPRPVVREVVRPEPPVEKPAPVKAAPVKPAISVSKSLVQKSDESARRDRQAEQRERDRLRSQQQATRALESSVEEALSGLRKVLSKETTVEMPGSGGAAYASYRQVVQTAYARAWIEPQELAGSQASVQVEVTINHDGRVLSERVVSGSGHRVLDRSVRDALDRVRAAGLPAFPEEARKRGDLQKVFRINFNLSSRNTLG